VQKNRQHYRAEQQQKHIDGKINQRSDEQYEQHDADRD
jgi:hypothetical protein